MKYVFFGTPEFASIVLDALLRADMPPVALVCNPDRPIGRKKIVTPPATKKLIISFVPAKAGIHVLQPENLDDSFQSQIKSLKPDFAIVAAYSKILPKEIIALFPKGMIGVHPSLLPKYRGSSPIQSAILGGDKETGVTLYLLDEKMDRGAIIASERCIVHSAWYYLELQKKLAELGGELLVETLPKFIAGKITPAKQDELQATFTKKFSTQDGFIEEKKLQDAQNGTSAEKAIMIDRTIRALNPEPGAWMIEKFEVRGSQHKGGKRIKLLESEIKDGKLVLKKIQEEGSKPKVV